MTDDVELNAADGDHEARVIVSPTAGGRICQIVVSGNRLLADSTDGDRLSTGWGLFPMAPWAGRIRNGRFEFLGRDVALDLNHEDGDGPGGGALTPPVPGTRGAVPERDVDRHAIHGTTFNRPWTVDTVDATRIEMSCALEGALGWPFAGIARQSIALTPNRLELEMTVESVDGTVFPASIGWHPWFAKPDRLDFEPVAMYQKDTAGLPTGRLVPPPPGPWDDCFVNHVPVRLHYDRPQVATVTVSGSTDHWVVYDQPEHATCVEPQSGPPDAPTVRPKVVAPGVPLRMTMTIDWD